MSAAIVLAGLLVTAIPAAPTHAVEAVDAAYEEVSAHRDREAIARIEAAGPIARAHPAQLINLALAYARQGQPNRARGLLRQAARAGEPYTLETADGQWASSRELALRALASLERGDRAGDGRVRTARR